MRNYAESNKNKKYIKRQLKVVGKAMRNAREICGLKNQFLIGKRSVFWGGYAEPQPKLKTQARCITYSLATIFFIDNDFS